jgi:hypothetical protein
MALDQALPLSMIVVTRNCADVLPRNLHAMDAAAFRYALQALE